MNPLTPFLFGIVYFAVAKTLSHYQNGHNRIQGKRWNVVVVAHNVFLAVYSAWTQVLIPFLAKFRTKAQLRSTILSTVSSVPLLKSSDLSLLDSPSMDLLVRSLPLFLSPTETLYLTLLKQVSSTLSAILSTRFGDLNNSLVSPTCSTFPSSTKLLTPLVFFPNFHLVNIQRLTFSRFLQAILLLKGKKVGMLQSYHHTGAIWTVSRFPFTIFSLDK